jgi:hypothetical protein
MPPARQRRLHQIQRELLMRDASRLEASREPGGGREAGIGVHFEDVWLVTADAEIDAGVVAAAEQVEGAPR